MAPARETSARDGAELWADVEDDVEKRRHVKDPFRQAYVALVAAPFDAFLANPARQRSGDGEEKCDDGDDDVDMDREESEYEGGGVDDHVALQQEISARSQQVHLRLEILRRQMQSLVEESSAVLDSRDIVAVKETNKKKKPPVEAEPLGDESGDGSIIYLDKLLERATLYESGELTDMELQKMWHRCRCPHDKYEVVGADEKLESMRTTLEEDFQSIREQNRLYFGPRLPVDSKDGNSVPSAEDPKMAQFLQDCKRSIKPFFLEDFVMLDDSNPQPDQDSESDDIAIYPNVEHEQPPAQSCPPVLLPNEDVILRGVESVQHESIDEGESVADVAMTGLQSSQRRSSGRNDNTSGRPVEPQPQRFCVESVRMSRYVFRKKATQINADCHGLEKLPIRMSRQSVDSVKFSKRPLCTRPPPLVCNSKKWGDVSMSVIDSAVNLVDLRDSLSVDLYEPLDDEQHTPLEKSIQYLVEPTSPLLTTQSGTGITLSQLSTASQVPTPAASFQAKRQLDIVQALQHKKPRVTEVAKPYRSLPLRLMIKSIRDACLRVAHTSCVSYLSALLRSGMGSCSPQRAFVALVFSASLTNTSQEQSRNNTDKPLRITLHSANAGRDVKIICSQE